MPIAKLTKKGQVTIPAEYRKLLGSEIVEITYENGKVVIKPIKSLGGILKKHALKGKSSEEIMKIEKEAISNGFTERERKRWDNT
jgi:AbrB family looped-hinge helix DNA binding protein